MQHWISLQKIVEAILRRCFAFIFTSLMMINLCTFCVYAEGEEGSSESGEKEEKKKTSIELKPYALPILKGNHVAGYIALNVEIQVIDHHLYSEINKLVPVIIDASNKRLSNVLTNFWPEGEEAPDAEQLLEMLQCTTEKVLKDNLKQDVHVKLLLKGYKFTTSHKSRRKI